MSYHRTATDLAAALLCIPRARQDVRVVSQTFGGGYFRAIVLVVPAGQETGTYYITRRQKAIDDLKFGRTPEFLGLEEFEASEADEDEYEREFDLKAHSRAMARSGAFGR